MCVAYKANYVVDARRHRCDFLMSSNFEEGEKERFFCDIDIQI